MPVIPCTTTPPTLGIVQFLPSAFVALYPEFTGLTNGAMSQAFNLATLLLNNSCGSIVIDANQRETLLDVLTAHVLFLSNGTNDGAGNITPPPGIVGRINTATEGAVSVGSELNAPPSASFAYFAQTKYGLLFWTLTANLRTMQYIPPPAGCGTWPFGGNGAPGCGC